MIRPPWLISLTILGLLLACSESLQAGDWPTWRATPERSGYVPFAPDTPLSLGWSRQLPAPMPAWPAEQGKIQFDASYEPVAADGRLFVPSMVSGGVTAYDLKSGKILWTRYCQAPVRFAPVIAEGYVYAVSDDGGLYCWEAASGQPRWIFQGAPENRWVLGNDRLIRMWPARGGPVYRDGVIYYAAGIWPFQGVFIYAIDARTGEEVWANSESGSRYLTQQHNSPAFAGVAPQGYLAASDSQLLVSGGRTSPASFDLHSGAFQYYRPGDRTLGKDAGGYAVMIGPDWHANHGGVYETATGSPWRKLAVRVLNDRGALAFENGVARLLQARPERKTATTKDRLGKTKTETKIEWKERWSAKLQGAERIHIQTGDVLWADGGDKILAFDLSQGPGEDKQLEPTWSTESPGEVWRMLATDSNLIVVTRDGGVYCYAAATESGKPIPSNDSQEGLAASPESNVDETDPGDLLDASLTTSGYTVVLGDSPKIVDWLLRNSKGRVVVLTRDAKAAASARARLDAGGWLGRRSDVVAPEWDHEDKAVLAPYLAELLVAPDAEMALRIARGETVLGAHLDILRPYNGRFCFPASPGSRFTLPDGYTVESPNGASRVVISRTGPLPGASSWTHQNGDIGNTLTTKERNLESPLGLLWFGGPSHAEVLPRHGHGPTPQVIGGRLFIEGPHMLRAVDVYTGRQLWQRQFPNLGLYYDNTAHHPGAGAIGGNFVTTRDSVYVAYGKKCLRLNPETGETIAEFVLPQRDGAEPYWGFLGVYEKYLIAGIEPTAALSKSRWKDDGAPRYGEASKGLAVLDRHSGELLWQRDAQLNFRHNAIVAGNDKLFVLDRVTSQRAALLKRRGLPTDGPEALVAFQIDTGDVLWKTEQGVFGTWLGYSAEQDVLLQAGSRNRDRAADEVSQGMAAYQGKSGEVLWRDDKVLYGGPCMLLGDRIITQGAAYGMSDGKRWTRATAFTSGEKEWGFTRAYGCNTAIGCPSLITFRSAAAGYFDLTHDSGTGNWGGFRSSCTANLIPADGVLNAPDYTRTCNCSYQNQCSLALVKMPSVEMWTFRQESWDGSPVERLGLNFAAPGDRVDSQGLLWLDSPSVGGPSPDVPVRTQGQPIYHKEHSLRAPSSDTPSWILATGVQRFDQLRVTLDLKDKKPKRYLVKLHVRVLSKKAAGSVIFRVQGKELAFSADASERRDATLIFRDVPVTEALELQADSAGMDPLQWMLCGLELQRVDAAPAAP